MYLDELLNKNYTDDQIAKILYSFSEFKDINLQRFLSGEQLVNRLALLTIVKNNSILNYFDLIAKTHPSKSQILFPTGEFKTVSNSSRIIRTATANHNNATMVSTTINNTRTDSNIAINNRIILPGEEVYLTQEEFDLNANLNTRQSSILLRNIETSSINTISNNIHQNNYKAFEGEELEFAKKYFSFKGSNIIPAPSFQFVMQKDNKVYINSIHIDKLIEYIEAIGNAYIKDLTYKETNRYLEYPPILKYDLGMPFQKILTKQIILSNDPVQNFITAMNNKLTKDCMSDLMKGKFPIKESLNSGAMALHSIYRALFVFREFISKHPDDIKTLITMTQCMNTILNTSFAPGYESISNNSAWPSLP